VLYKGYQRFKFDQIQAQSEARSVHADLVDSRVEAPLETVRSNRMMVALTFGQSASSNSGESRKKANEKVFNFYNGRIYQAEDPLIGATGDGGSIWTRLRDQLINLDLYETVIFVPVGVNGSIIAQWQPGGDSHEKLLGSIKEVRDSGLTITHLFWHQGESDAIKNTGKEAYQKMFSSHVGQH
jgi:Carbohydrate esterase, sialic acid-specific acetylesterase